jgi:PAS domain S-box-containing protein
LTAQPPNLPAVSALLDHLPEALFILDAQERVSFVNLQAAQLLGSGPELGGQKLWTLWPSQTGGPLQAAVASALKSGVTGHCRWTGPDGHRYEARLFPLEGGLGVQLTVAAPEQESGTAEARSRLALRGGSEVLATLGDALQKASTPKEVAELALAQLGPALRARSMLVVRLMRAPTEGEGRAEIELPTLWGDTPEPIMMYMTRPGLTLEEMPILLRAAQTKGGVYLADYRADQHAVSLFPALACGAEPIQTPDGTLEGFLVAWRDKAAAGGQDAGWQDDERELMRRAAGTLGLALERAAALAAVEARRRQVEEEARAQTAFMAFTEAVGTETEVLGLARQAIEVLQAHFPNGSFSYYEYEGQTWKALAWSSDVGEQMVRTIRAGFPEQTPIFAEALSTRQPVFRDAWDFEREQLARNDEYATLATCPLVVGDVVRGMLGLGLRDAGHWRERDRALIRAVRRGLTLALERADATTRLEEQNRELVARTQALESFAVLTRSLAVQSDPRAFVRRAQEVILSLLPPGYALYYERDGARWRSRVQVGEVGNPALQDFIDAGPVVGELPTLDLTWSTQRPQYLDLYEKGLDTPRELVEHVNTVASLPVLLHGETVGVLLTGLFAERPWSAVDRAMLETVVSSLELALERAEQARQLEEQNLELQARTQALESFAQLGRELGNQDDRYLLIQRAQEVVLSLLPEGFAAYFEPDPDGVRWALRTQVGTNSNQALQKRLDMGLDWEQTQNLLTPWRSGLPLFQDTYDLQTDGVGEVFEQRGAGATATLPLIQGGSPIGIFTIALTESRRWTKADRAVLDGVLQSLSLALERSRTTRELNRSQHYLKVVADNAPLLLFATDAQGIFTLSEGRLLADLGLKPGEAVGQSATELFDHEPDLQAGLRLNRALAGEAVQDLLHFREQGLVYETWFTPIHSAAGEVTEVVGVSLDVTSRLAAQQALERSNLELARSNDELMVANEGLEAFSSSVSHDLRTPVRHVKGFSELARRALNEAAATPTALGAAIEKAHNYMLVVEQAAGRMSSLIDAMLNLSRTSSQPLRLGPVDLNLLLERARTDIEQDLPGREVDWKVGRLPTVMGDQDTLQQVLTNLLSNAAKYSRTRERAQIEVWAEAAGQAWTISVRDNGVGFDPVYKDKLFGVFQRLHSEREFEGTGVGLATVRRVVLRHGGQVHADSVLGQGATFSFTLPSQDHRPRSDSWP